MKKKVSVVLLVAFVCCLALTGCGGTQPQTETEQETGVEVQVFAAASLTDCLDEIITLYQEESADTIIPVYEASGTLKKQIEEGADCDIFISANQKHMDGLEEAGAIDSATRKDLLGNSLTLIASEEKAEQVTSIADLQNDTIELVAIGEPSEVPAGQYAQEAFENLGMWDTIQPKLVYAKNVRAVLNYVDSGDADAGLVYHTDALLLEHGKIIGDAPADSYTAVYYPAAVMQAAPQPEAAAAFYEFLQTEQAKEIFEKYGFTAL